MARSTYIYIIMTKYYYMPSADPEDENCNKCLYPDNESADYCEEECILKAFTVKHELISWIKDHCHEEWAEDYDVYRCTDGIYGDKVTKMDIKELLN